ncbi:unnamed protein product [Auanema sp. JU1783]|nr:unnamed protein product [Auanema sp. JU1783]
MLRRFFLKQTTNGSAENIIELMEYDRCPKESAGIRVHNRREPQGLSSDDLALYSLVIVMAVLALCAFIVTGVILAMLV